MKNKIEYYYNLVNIKIYEKEKKYFFEYNNKKYMFFICYRNYEELKQIDSLTYNKNNYLKIVKNINNDLITIINEQPFILVIYNSNFLNAKVSLRDFIYKVNVDIKKYPLLLRNDWYKLWSEKIDYLQYQRIHIARKYPLLEQYFDYFVGMAETAISYFRNTMSTKEAKLTTVYVISHKRINSLSKIDYYNIDNLIIDYPERDISELFKYMFIHNDIDYSLIAYLLNKKNALESRLLFARMLFPSYFFDIYEQVINFELDQKIINNILINIDKYELFLKYIYNEISKKNKIPSIEWLS